MSLNKILLFFMISLMSLSYADVETLKKESKSKIDQIDKVHTRLELQLAKAEDQSDIRQVNCVSTKLNLVKGLLKSSQRAALILIKAEIDKQPTMVATYKKRIQDYQESAIELEASIEECLPKSDSQSGPLLVMMRPEGETMLDFQDVSPWFESYIETAGNLPIVPPASPFR